MIKNLFVFVGALCATMALSFAPASARPPVSLKAILGQEKLWGRDFSAALLSLPSWRDIGERKVAVFADRIVGETSYRTRAEAQRPSIQLDVAMRSAPRRLATSAADLFKPTRNGAQGLFRAEPVALIDDDLHRVAQTSDGLQLLAASLTFDRLEKLIGRPQSVTVQMVHALGDRRPVDLTFHSYADGSIVFVETDLAPQPGLVDRAVIDVPAAMALMFEEAPR